MSSLPAPAICRGKWACGTSLPWRQIQGNTGQVGSMKFAANSCLVASLKAQHNSICSIAVWLSKLEAARQQTGTTSMLEVVKQRAHPSALHH